MLNQIVIMGRLARDPELRYTKSDTPVASFTVAVDRDYKAQDGSREADFIDCTAWRQGAEFVQKNFSKGQMIVVTGSLQSRKWEDRDGNKRTAWEILVDHTYFGEPKRTEERYSAGSYGPRSYGNPNVSVDPGMHEMAPGTGEGNPFTELKQQHFDDYGEDGDLPF